MTAIANHSKETNSVYPGQYHPLPFDARKEKESLKKRRKGANQPFANIIECDDHYKVEIVAPGHAKDDFVVTIENGQMEVFALGGASVRRKQPFYLSHAFDYDYFRHSVPLPKNIDTDFLSAEYNEGILSICFPKSDKPADNALRHVIVY